MTNKNLNLLTNSEGYLVNFKDWNENIAMLIAQLENISLQSQHWEIIYSVRSFYKTSNMSPTIRLLIKTITLKYGLKKGHNIYLYRLFPKNEMARVIAKISGLPKPSKCL